MTGASLSQKLHFVWPRKNNIYHKISDLQIFILFPPSLLALWQVLCSGVVEDKVKVVTAAGHDMILEVDEDGNVLVGGVKLMLRDKMTTNGVIHVIGKKAAGLLCSLLILIPAQTR